MVVEELTQKIEREWISIRRLKDSLDQMRLCGFWPAKVEAGSQTFEVLVNYTVSLHYFPAHDEPSEELRASWEGKLRLDLMRGVTNMEFNGMRVVMCDDVPEGIFWPTRETNTIQRNRCRP